MKNFLILSALVFTQIIISQTVFGNWKTIDDVTGEPKSIVQVYEENGKVYGKIIEIFNPENRNKTCTECTGKLKDKPLIGMVFLYNLKKDGKEYNDGNIVDPKTGKEYSCYIELQDNNTLKVRGYVGISIAGRTQYWKRVKQ
jgi:uncharacterized protein (DUF2147 family)